MENFKIIYKIIYGILSLLQREGAQDISYLLEYAMSNLPCRNETHFTKIIEMLKDAGHIGGVTVKRRKDGEIEVVDVTSSDEGVHITKHGTEYLLTNSFMLQEHSRALCTP